MYYMYCFSNILRMSVLFKGDEMLQLLENKETEKKKTAEEKEQRKADREKKKKGKGQREGRKEENIRGKEKEREMKKKEQEMEKERKRRVKERKQRVKDVGEDICVLCFETMPIFEDDDMMDIDVSWVQCGVCEGWAHISCVKHWDQTISDQTISEDENYTCDECFHLLEEE